MRAARLAPALLVAASAVAVYLGTLPHELVYDDHALLRVGAAVREAGPASAFAADLWRGDGLGGTNYYRPLASLALAAHGGAASPWALRLVNLLLHAVASLLVLRLVGDLLRGDAPEPPAGATVAALASALVFAVHPVHVEAVAWVSGFMDVASAAAALAAFDLYRRAEAGRRPALRRGAGLLLFALALLLKESAAVLPVVLVAHDLLRGRRAVEAPATGDSSRLRRWATWFVLLGLYLLLRTAALGGLAPRERPDLGGAGRTLALVADLSARYVRVTLVPTDLSLGHSAPPLEGWATARGAAAAGTLVAGLALFALARRRLPAAAFGMAFFAIALAPALYLPGLAPQLEKLFAERFLYLPSVGACVVLGAGVAWAAARGGRTARAAFVLAGLLVLTLAGATLRQGRVWRNEVTLWTDAVAKFPASGWNQLDLANALAARGDAAAAQRAYARAAVLEPRLVPLFEGQGAELLRARRPLDALLKFEQARALDADSFPAVLGAAHAHAALGGNAAAEARFRDAVALRPHSAAARTGLGILLARRGDLAGAIEQLEAAAGAAPGDPTALRNLAAALEQGGESGRAAELRARAAALGAP